MAASGSSVIPVITIGRFGSPFILFFCFPSHAGKVIVLPQDGAGSINDRINELSAGDTMIFLPGVYKGPFSLNGVNGRPNLPIVITGIAKDPEMATIDGKSELGMGLLQNAFQLQDCSWIVIEGFGIQNCWTDIITAVNVSYLSIKQCDVVGGKRLLFAKGTKKPPISS